MRTWALLLTITIVQLAFGQQSTTTIQDGSTGTDTPITCDGTVANSHCNVYDSTDLSIGLGDRHADNRARAKWCTATGFASTKGGQTPCGLAWQDHKGLSSHACQDKFGVAACKVKVGN